jgi:cardiolipin synthase
MLKHIPNFLTTFRLALVPIFVWFFWSDREDALIMALFIYLLAGLTDVLDGFIARRFQLITKIGTVLDPLADKMMLMTALVCLFLKSLIPFIVLLIMILKELFLILGAIYLFFSKDKVVIPANKLGKAATILFTLTVALLLIQVPNWITMLLIVLAIAMKLVAFTSYIKTYFKSVRHAQQT